ncbi:MAG: sulfatase family protein [Lewinella sp.]|uniref:sulfatase family protein n=1 Tax=Lewinella sp. TaxID=2004506 RepID=UPI003D6A9477
MKVRLVMMMIGSVLVSGCSPLSSETNIQHPDRPNIILILADDLSKEALGCYGNRNVQTPTIDYWAAHGWQLESFYVTSPVCSPSRASILTGHTAEMNEVERVLRPHKMAVQAGLSTTIPSLAECLGENGYRTALLGKWHLGYRPEEHPLSRGFDFFRGFIGGHIDYISHVDATNRYRLLDGREALHRPGKHLTELITDEAIGYIENASRDTPYFMLLAYANPHRPYLLPGEEGLFPGNSNRDGIDTPENYLKLVELLDRQLARIQAVLSKRDNNTVIVFISDNGFTFKSAGKESPQGGKGTLFETGLGVPGIFYWPGKLQAQVIEEVVLSTDIFPTLTALADDEIHYEGSGLSIIADTGIYNRPQREIYQWSFGPAKVVRQGDWKAIFLSNDGSQITTRHFEHSTFTRHYELSTSFSNHFPLLFNLAEDPREQTDLSLSDTEKLHQLWAIYQNSK